MSTITLTFPITVDGVLTNATSVKFSNAAGTRGVIRDDTLDSVVAVDTALTNTSTGIYSGSWSTPADNLSYTAYVEWVLDGETYNHEFNIVDDTTPASSATATPSISEPEVLLFCDAIDHLVDVVAGATQDRNARVLKKAVKMALDEICNVREWQYFNRWGRVSLNAPYSTGTIAYDHTGGASERLVTLSSGTWPTWAARGKLLIDSVAYDVESYLSTTTLTLTANHNPGADVASGTSYVIYQNEYPLSPLFRSMLLPLGVNHGAWEYVLPEVILEFERLSPSSQSPRRFSVIGSREVPGSFILQTEPYPSTAETLDFPFQAFPRRLRRTGFEAASYQGSVTISAGSRAVTGSGTAFNANMVGAVLRLTTSTSSLPTSDDGTNPYDEQLTIESVSSTTALTLVNAAQIAYSTAKYVVSDPVHLDRTLFNAFLHAAAHHYAALTGDKKANEFYALYKAALKPALEWDSKVSEHGPQVMDGNWTVDLSTS